MARDLGVFFSDNLKTQWDINIAHSVKRTWGVINTILRTFRSRSPKIMVTLLKCQMIPVLLYGSCIWGRLPAYLMRRVENVQKKFTRLIKVKNLDIINMPYEQRLKCFNLFSVQRIRELNI